MRRLISPKRMLECERAYFENSGVASIDMMECAAQALLRRVIALAGGQKRVYFACGPGGNGGDGYACARLWHAMGGESRIFEAMPARSADAIENRDRAIEAGIPLHSREIMDAFPPPDIWVDAIYGTGLSRAPEGGSADLIRRMNADRERGSRILSADIPSGLNGRTGLMYEPCVQADETVTFGLAKFGHYLQDGLDVCGKVHAAPIGFPAEAFPEKLPLLLEPADLRALFALRKRNIYKNRCGHLLVVAGSFGMAGAAALCAKAALRSGVGLVSIACPENVVSILQALAPQAMCIPLPCENGRLSEASAEVLRENLPGKTAIAIGCGLGRNAPAGLVRAALESGLPAVVDADALNIISEHPELKYLLQPWHVLTPHPGEARRLAGRELGADAFENAELLCRMRACVVLKGASRIIAQDGAFYVSASGASCMARGGSGDVLTGVMGALIAENSHRTPPASAAAACEIHGLCGELAQAKYGPRAANSADLIEFLPEVFREYVD